MDKDICTAAKPCIGLKTLELVQYIVMYFMYSVKNPRIGEVHDHVLLALVHLVDWMGNEWWWGTPPLAPVVPGRVCLCFCVLVWRPHPHFAMSCVFGFSFVLIYFDIIVWIKMYGHRKGLFFVSRSEYMPIHVWWTAVSSCDVIRVFYRVHYVPILAQLWFRYNQKYYIATSKRGLAACAGGIAEGHHTKIARTLIILLVYSVYLLWHLVTSCVSLGPGMSVDGLQGSGYECRCMDGNSV
jgi:hypothetical protein